MRRIMRLIDADKLHDYWSPDGGRAFPADYFLFTIEIAPTVEAIPISVIKDEIYRLGKCQLYTEANYLGWLLTYWELVMKGDEETQ